MTATPRDESTRSDSRSVASGVERAAEPNAGAGVERLHVDRGGYVWADDTERVVVGEVYKRDVQGRTTPRWFAKCVDHGEVGYLYGCTTRKRALIELTAHRRPWFVRTVTLTADGHEPFTHTSRSQSTDAAGSAHLCAEVWLLGHPERRVAENIVVTVDQEEVEPHA